MGGLDLKQVKTANSGVSPVERLHALIAADMAATDKLIHARMSSGVALIPVTPKTTEADGKP